MRHQRLVRAGAAAASILLLVSACSTDREGEDPSGDESNAAAPAADLPTDSFGELESPCGEGDASGATDQGVPDD